ncbi:hypothetical protein BDBG_06819 [Blastomyces gilchristii SLH14081]|uniref:Uncharacterized protein n=1 Tax=Blastomyces gilchristii (strain SLH14081) TaxID=559298 RepID=A0A179UVP1_BLAGS|nr:uncharacterized protein BDBG_06819 [Blastomyces gilchristii SLH14081]OAT11299.1 hypothetical protein BDBG_06819 [Blastomyces gilchristii SLH14081]
MLRSRFELGSTIHIYKNEEIRLRTATSVEVSCPDSMADLDRSTLLEALQSRDVWVFSKPHLELKISIGMESSLHRYDRSVDGILKEMRSTLIKSQLWHNLQASMVSANDEILTSEEGIDSLNCVFEFQQKSGQFPLHKPPRMPHTLRTRSSAIDPPPSVLRIHLCDICIHFSFLSKSSNTTSKASFDSMPRCTSFEDLSSILSPPGGCLAEMDPTLELGDTCHSSLGGSQTRVQSDDDWMSLDYDSPFCSQQTSSIYSYRTMSPLQTELPRVPPKATYQPFMTLLNSGFCALLGQTTPQTTSSITTIIETPGPSLQEFAPSLFIPGYDTNIRQRAHFIPMLSKGIAAMLDNVPQPDASIQLESAASVSVFPEANYERDGRTSDFTNTTNTKSGLKSLLWRSMHRRLFTLVARQLPSLTTPLKPTKNGTSQTTIPSKSPPDSSIVISDPVNDQSLHPASISDTEWCFSEESDDDDTLPTLKLNSEPSDRDTYLTNSFQIQHSDPVRIISPNHDDEHDLLDNIPNTIEKPTPFSSPTIAILDDDLDILEHTEHEEILILDTPYLHPLQTESPGQSSTSLTSTTRSTITATATVKGHIPPSASPPSSEMENLDPSSPAMIPEELLLSPTLHPFNATITDPHNATDLFDAKLPRSPHSDGSGSGFGGEIWDAEMLLL